MKFEYQFELSHVGWSHSVKNISFKKIGHVKITVLLNIPSSCRNGWYRIALLILEDDSQFENVQVVCTILSYYVPHVSL